jgi:hypothetical protein
MAKRLFISQPMRDKTNEQIERERAAAIKSVKEKYGEDVEVIDSFFKNAPHDARPLWFLAKALELLSTADVAYFCKDYENYRGCRIEFECAVEYEIECVIVDYKENDNDGSDETDT